MVWFTPSRSILRVWGGNPWPLWSTKPGPWFACFLTSSILSFLTSQMLEIKPTPPCCEDIWNYLSAVGFYCYLPICLSVCRSVCLPYLWIHMLNNRFPNIRWGLTSSSGVCRFSTRLFSLLNVRTWSAPLWCSALPPQLSRCSWPGGLSASEMKPSPAPDLSPKNVASCISTSPVFARTDSLFSAFGLSPLQRENWAYFLLQQG